MQNFLETLEQTLNTEFSSLKDNEIVKSEYGGLKEFSSKVMSTIPVLNESFINGNCKENQKKEAISTVMKSKFLHGNEEQFSGRGILCYGKEHSSGANQDMFYIAYKDKGIDKTIVFDYTVSEGIKVIGDIADVDASKLANIVVMRDTEINEYNIKTFLALWNEARNNRFILDQTIYTFNASVKLNKINEEK